MVTSTTMVSTAAASSSSSATTANRLPEIGLGTAPLSQLLGGLLAALQNRRHVHRIVLGEESTELSAHLPLDLLPIPADLHGLHVVPRIEEVRGAIEGQLLATEPVHLENAAQLLRGHAGWQHPADRGPITPRLAVHAGKAGELTALLHREDEQYVAGLAECLVQIRLVLRQRRPHVLRLGQRHIVRVVRLDDEEARLPEQVIQLRLVIVRFGTLVIGRRVFAGGRLAGPLALLLVTVRLIRVVWKGEKVV